MDRFRDELSMIEGSYLRRSIEDRKAVAAAIRSSPSDRRRPRATLYMIHTLLLLLCKKQRKSRNICGRREASQRSGRIHLHQHMA